MNFLRRVMYGRYGVDQLGLCLAVLYLVLALVGSFTRWWVMNGLGLLVAAYAIFRMFSRNISGRRRENEWFLKITAGPRKWWRTRRMVHADKEHKYFKCPSCGQHLRVPKVNGKIKVTCRSCGTSFEKKL